jgi:hypothetical protein
MMIVWKNCALSALAAVALLAASGDARAGLNLVQNGDFSQNGGLGQLGNGVSYATDWTSSTSGAFNFIVNANADSTGFPSQNSPPNIFIWGPNTGVNSGLNAQFVDVANGFTGPPNGDQYWLGMDGAYNPGPVSQTINGLTVGHQYTLTFDWAESQFALGANNTAVMGPTTQALSVSLGGDSASTGTHTLASQGFSGWMQFTTTFTASSTSEPLTFLASGSPAGLPPFLMVSGVGLVDSTMANVPEPSSILLLGVSALGLIGVGLRRRFKATKR